MAQTIYCDAECELAAQRIITDTETGESLAFCLEHFVVFCMAMGDSARAEATELADVPDDGPQAAVVADEGEEEPATPAPKSRKPPAATETNGADHASEEAAQAAAD